MWRLHKSLCHDCFVCQAVWCVDLESSVRDSLFTSIAWSSHCFLYPWYSWISFMHPTWARCRTLVIPCSASLNHFISNKWSILLWLMCARYWIHPDACTLLLHCNTLKHANCIINLLLHPWSKVSDIPGVLARKKNHGFHYVAHTWVIAWLYERLYQSMAARMFLEVHCTGISLFAVWNVFTM